MAKKNRKRKDRTKVVEKRTTIETVRVLDEDYRRAQVRTTRAEWGLCWVTECVRNEDDRIVNLTVQWISRNKLIEETLDLKDQAFSVAWMDSYATIEGSVSLA